jgi:hypothetical protein
MISSRGNDGPSLKQNKQNVLDNYTYDDIAERFFRIQDNILQV